MVVVVSVRKSSAGLSKLRAYQGDPRQQALVIIAFVEFLGDVHVLGDREVAESNLIWPNPNDRSVLDEKGMDGLTLLESERV